MKQNISRRVGSTFGGNFKKYLLVVIILEIFFTYTPVFAQVTPYNYATDAGVAAQIKKYLCTPSDVEESQTSITNGALNSPSNFQQRAAFNNKSSGDLYTCINKIYRFAIILAGVVGVFFIVIAGYVYMSAEGNDESVSKAKDILATTITSMVILMAGFILLKAINPDLIRFNNVQPPSVTGLPTAPIPGMGTGTGTTPTPGTTPGTGTYVGGTPTGSANGRTPGTGVCVAITDPASPVSVSNLQNSCLKSNATLFSQIAYEETRGQNIPSSSDKCGSDPVSFGYFQINITVTKVGSLNCPAAFTKPFTASDKSCLVKDRDLYEKCKTAILTPAQNIQTACDMSNNGTNLSPWNGSCFNKWVPN